MNEEPMFRAWIKDQKLMVDVVAIDFYNSTISYIYDNYTDGVQEWIYEDLENVELLQNTGLKDHEETSIYNKDIFWSDDSGEYVFIEYQKGAFYINHNTPPQKTLLSKEHDVWFVRGNMLQNPELLEVK